MSLNEAKRAAIELASPLVAASETERWACAIGIAKPHPYEPKLAGKTPTRWIVHVQSTPRDEPDATLDGGDGYVLVNLIEETAYWE